MKRPSTAPARRRPCASPRFADPARTMTPSHPRRPSRAFAGFPAVAAALLLSAQHAPAPGCAMSCGASDPAAGCDVDGDGFAAAACGGPDCDDEDAAVRPGAPEAAGNGRDDDCDGATDEADDDDASAASVSASGLCASPGTATNGVHRVTACTGPLSASGGVASNGTWTLVAGAPAVVAGD